ncbi:hypothetical protein SAMN06297144_0111 [Sphingomonas guangdongensis]|uniref:Uncharacterized protein n=1 Tax=Sphingomonas guangdongensis TaxID=1141890 RepID=A0A285Q9I7_9SPHN|nr:hypothetical protein [Sphingomonas guangdongensis]SOB78605.1 hypothetical protein SAMN06297144_0111 [Sphingomonas guangdongensis]
MRWVSGGLPASVAPRLLSAMRDADRARKAERLTSKDEASVETVDA